MRPAFSGASVIAGILKPNRLSSAHAHSPHNRPRPVSSRIQHSYQPNPVHRAKLPIYRSSAQADNHGQYFPTAQLARARCVNAPRTDLPLGVDAGMTRLTRLCRAVGVGLAVATATLAMTQMANAAPSPRRPSRRTSCRSPAARSWSVTRRACRSTRATATKWALPSVPRADLFNDAGNLIVKHFAGPTWTATADNSAVTARRSPGTPRCAPR